MIKSHVLYQLSYRGGQSGRDDSRVDQSVQRPTTLFDESFSKI